MAKRKQTKTPSASSGAQNTKHVFASGAARSKKMPRYHLIPYAVFMKRLADRYALGEEKYGLGNWEKGLNDREFTLDAANHLLEHAHNAVEHLRNKTKPSEDELAAVIWNAIYLMAAGE